MFLIATYYHNWYNVNYDKPREIFRFCQKT